MIGGIENNDNDPLGILKKKNNDNDDPLGILKKKSSINVGGGQHTTPSNPFLNAQKPTGTISEEQLNAAQKGITASKNKSTERGISAGTELEREMISDKNAFSRDEINKAAINTATRYFKNNPNLVYGLNKLRNKNDISLKNMPAVEQDMFSIKSLKNSTPFQRKVAEIKTAFENGDLALTKFQSGEQSGEPVFTKSAKFLRGIGQGIEQSISLNKDAIVNMTSDDKKFADYLDKQQRNLPEVPEEAPGGIANDIGVQLGSLVKPIAEFSGGAALTSETGGWGGFVALGADVIPTTTTAKVKQLYYDRMDQLREQYGDNIPEEERIKAMQDARSDAPMQAVPEEAMQMYLFGRGGNALGDVSKGGLSAFKNSLMKAGVDIPKMGLTGGIEEAATLGIEGLQGRDVKDASKKIGQAIEDWATMEAAFKIAFGAINAPKYLRSSAKEAISELPLELQNKLSEQAISQGWITQEQAIKGGNDLQQYDKIRKTLPDDISPEKASAITGLMQKNENLEAEKKNTNPILHDAIDVEIDNNTAKAKQILNSNQPLKYETDNLTGEKAQDVGGRPLKEEPVSVEIPKRTGEQTEENGISVIEPTVRPSEGVEVQMPEQINRPETITIGNEKATAINEQKANVSTKDIFDAFDDADRSKISRKAKLSAVEDISKQFGEEGIKAFNIHRNFDDITNQLISEKKLERICP